ncbi:MAG: hypothetical protein AB7F59_11520 [Bdellovibrionales bacterium]
MAAMRLHMSGKDVAFLKRKLKSLNLDLKSSPAMKFQKDHIVWNGKTIQLAGKDPSAGFMYNGKLLKYNSQKSLEMNYIAFLAQLGRQVSLFDFIIPTASAQQKTKAERADELAGMAVVLAVAGFIFDAPKWFIAGAGVTAIVFALISVATASEDVSGVKDIRCNADGFVIAMNDGTTIRTKRIGSEFQVHKTSFDGKLAQISNELLERVKPHLPAVETACKSGSGEIEKVKEAFAQTMKTHTPHSSGKPSSR